MTSARAVSITNSMTVSLITDRVIRSKISRIIRWQVSIISPARTPTAPAPPPPIIDFLVAPPLPLLLPPAPQKQGSAKAVACCSTNTIKRNNNKIKIFIRISSFLSKKEERYLPLSFPCSKYLFSIWNRRLRFKNSFICLATIFLPVIRQRLWKHSILFFNPVKIPKRRIEYSLVLRLHTCGICI